MKIRRFWLAVIVFFVCSPILIHSQIATQRSINKSSRFLAMTTIDGMKSHMILFDKFAKKNNNHRAATTAGYDQCALYVATKLWLAGYKITTDQLTIPTFEEKVPPVFEQVSPSVVTYPSNDTAGFYTLGVCGAGDITGSVQGLDIIIPPGEKPQTSNCGCESIDFKDFKAGNIALIQRGTCTFLDKVLNAQAAGAIAVIIFNEGQPGRTQAIKSSINSDQIKIPVIFCNYTIGKDLYLASLQQEVKVHIKVVGGVVIKKSSSIIASTRLGDSSKVVMFGAHLDGVTTGPGMNDNASGSAAILEAALALSRSKMPVTNKIKFAFWTGEELGLLGSTHYVQNLTPEQISCISAYINFDMIASSNYVRFIYDGNGSADNQSQNPPPPPGSETIEELFYNFFSVTNLETDEMSLSIGRTDFVPFQNKGIAVGGMTTGADGIKTTREAEIYGGVAGKPHDPYYHTINDNLENINWNVAEQILEAITYAVFVCASSDLPKQAYRERYLSLHHKKLSDSEYYGPLLVK